ncbi:MAG: trypsin-like peptidase domain-containing protein [Chloroflexi bacterium]|nr:trypsin-like peptidase domain-containing protein [Chloroflexota bacterium]
MPSTMQRLNTELASVVETAKRSLVQVHNGGRGVGAGTIWHPEGLIVTNAHVVSGRTGSLRVTLPDGSTLPARLLARDEDRDVAALVVEAVDLPTIDVGKSRDLSPGQWVMALGHPWGVRGAVTAGVVIGVGSTWPEMPQGGREWITAALHLRPGHSGGPLIDVDGRLVGINTMMTGPDMGMAIPVHEVKVFLRDTVGSQRRVA